MELILEFSNGVSNEEQRVATPDAEKARAALKNLDGARVSLLVADDKRGRILMIGGGNEGRFVVNYLVNGDEHSFLLVNSNGIPKDVSVVAGGQLGFYPGDKVVGESLAAEALIYFVATGRRDEALTWQQEF